MVITHFQLYKSFICNFIARHTLCVQPLDSFLVYYENKLTVIETFKLNNSSNV